MIVSGAGSSIRLVRRQPEGVHGRGPCNQDRGLQSASGPVAKTLCAEIWLS
jgi:hypothetical protein